jgi:hypothetical protein
MAIKDRIYAGNTFALAYESLEPSSDGGFIETPMPPVSAYAEMWDVQNQEFIDLGVVGPNGVGAACTVEGNVISFTVPTSATGEAGDFRLFTTAVYADGQEVTEVHEFKIKARA